MTEPPRFDLEPLENRTLLAAPEAALTTSMRQEIIAHWAAPNKATLQAKLDQSVQAFDSYLLDYMADRSGETFFWKTADIPGIKNFINAHLLTSAVIDHANDVVAHRFPNGRSQVYDVKLPAGDFDWTTSNSNPEFVHALNRHEFWLELSQAYVLEDDDRYIDELVSQFSSWATQFRAKPDPEERTNDSPWQPLDVALRTKSWTWVYQQVLGSDGWTPAANTLFIYHLYRHGNFLRRVEPYELEGNRALSEAQALVQLAQLVPEFDRSAEWKTYGRHLLFRSMDAQLRPDGGHFEQSPGYASTVILALLESYWLDSKKGDGAAWSTARLERLHNSAKAFTQLLTPDAQLAALSDTYRGPVGPFLNKPRVILKNTRDFPAARARLRDVWLFGSQLSQPMKDAPVNPMVPNRGNTYAMPQSGYYMMRSGEDSSARQITFDAGPKGGNHGHFDLFSFELFGYGKPLISDPGLYNYDASVRRNWAISTPAHNTISIDGKNHAPIDGPNVWSSGISQVAGGYQISARHRGYAHLDGSPILNRSIWFDGDDVMVVADLGQGGEAHKYTQSFLLPGTNVDRDLDAGWMRTLNSGGNVMIRSLLQPGQAAGRQVQIDEQTDVFTSDGSDANIAKPATRFFVHHNAKSVGFITLITTFEGSDAPDITAKLVGSTARGAFKVQIYRDGVAAELIPFFSRPGEGFSGGAPSAGANDIAWDPSGQLQLVYNDRDERTLKYSVRDTGGRWSIVQTIDGLSGAGEAPSLAIDANGKPAVAYYDANRADLKFAHLVGSAWQVQTVDSVGRTGFNPSLVYSRDGGTALIAYYDGTNGDLRVAVQGRDGWTLRTVDSAGDVGRFPSAVVDPNQPAGNRLAVAYDTAEGVKKFAVQAGEGWDIATVDSSMSQVGGYTSLAYEPYKRIDGRYHAAMSYFDRDDSALKFAREQIGGGWASTTVIAQGVQGLYTTLIYDSTQRPNIFFYTQSVNGAYRARLTTEWAFTSLGASGTELQVSRRSNGQIAYTRLDAGGLRVETLAS